jgi:hypothetical protein
MNVIIINIPSNLHLLSNMLKITKNALNPTLKRPNWNVLQFENGSFDKGSNSTYSCK